MNGGFQTRIAIVPGGVQMMEAAGFRLETDTEGRVRVRVRVRVRNRVRASF
jgi:hypothetical protein